MRLCTFCYILRFDHAISHYFGSFISFLTWNICREELTINFSTSGHLKFETHSTLLVNTKYAYAHQVVEWVLRSRLNQRKYNKRQPEHTINSGGRRYSETTRHAHKCFRALNTTTYTPWLTISASGRFPGVENNNNNN